MESMRAANRLCMTGCVECEPRQDHVCCQNVLYSFGLRVPRQSGVSDSIRVLVGEKALSLPLRVGDFVRVMGQLRAYHRNEANQNRLYVTAFAHTISPSDSVGENHIALCGRLLNDPAPRLTPLGREIADLLVSVERTHGRRDTIPVIAWGRNARFCASWSAGACVQAEGRLQSRVYRKLLPSGEAEERIAYEVSAFFIERIG